MQTSTLRHTSWCWCQKNLCFHGKYNFPHIQELTSWTNSFFFYTFWWVNKHLQGLLPVSSLDLYTFPRAASSNTYEAGMKTNGDQFFDRIFVSICIDRDYWGISPLSQNELSAFIDQNSGDECKVLRQDFLEVKLISFLHSLLHFFMASARKPESTVNPANQGRSDSNSFLVLWSRIFVLDTTTKESWFGLL